MKLCHIITTLEHGGAEKQLLILVKAQVNAGNEVTVVSLKGQNTLLKEFEEAGAEVLRLSGIKQNKKLTNFFVLIRILRKVQIVHAHLPRAEIFTRICLLFIKNVSFVISRHNEEPFMPSANYAKQLSPIVSRFISKRADVVIAISNAVRKFLESNNEIAREVPIIVIHYGFKKVRKSHDLPKEVDKLRIGTVARLVNQKSLDTAILSVALLKRNSLKFEYKIAGNGPLKEELNQLASENDISGEFVLVGKIEQIEKFYSELDLFVLPSKYEGFGMVLFEAMNANVPIICSNVSAIPEVMGSEYPGLFEWGNVEELVELMKRAYSPEFRVLLTKHYDEILDRFSVEKMYSEIHRAYLLALRSI
jgi:glycosyltransferase involved in cell wall biosynthesis